MVFYVTKAHNSIWHGSKPITIICNYLLNSELLVFSIPATFVAAVFARALKAIASRSVAREKRFVALACVGAVTAHPT